MSSVNEHSSKVISVSGKFEFGNLKMSRLASDGFISKSLLLCEPACFLHRVCRASLYSRDFKINFSNTIVFRVDAVQPY